MKKLIALVVLTAGISFAYESLQGPTEMLYWNKEKAFNGYTLFAAHGSSYLIDMQGQLVHSWRIGTNPRFLQNGNLLDAMQDDPSSFKGFQEQDWDGNVIWKYEEVRPNYAPHHDFVRIFNQKLNQWTTMYIAGKTVTREMALATGCDPSKAPAAAGEEPGRGSRLAKDGKTMVDAVVEVDMNGNVVWEWCFFDHLVQNVDPAKSNYVAKISDAPGRLNMHLPGKPLRGDWLHCNSMDYNPELDQVVINSVQGEFYVIDHGATFVPGDPAKSIALAAGPAGDFLYRFGDPARYEQGDPPSISENWTKGISGHKQIGGAHDVQWIPAGLPGAGHFLIFNNGQYLFDPSAQSFVYEIDGFRKADGTAGATYVNPPEAGYVQQDYHPDMQKTRRLISRQIVWLYGSKSSQGFFSSIGSGAQRLPNGNTLICSDAEGHFFEVTAQNELVWEYINPVTKEFGVLKVMPDTIPMANSSFRCYRYSADHPALKGRDLTPKGLLTDVVVRPARKNPADEKFPQPGDAKSAPQQEEKPAARKAVAVATPAAATNSPAAAAPRPQGGGDRFTQMDANKDGAVSFDEMAAHEKAKRGDQYNEEQLRRKFEAMDADRNGLISKDEMDRAPKGK